MGSKARPRFSRFPSMTMGSDAAVRSRPQAAQSNRRRGILALVTGARPGVPSELQAKRLLAFRDRVWTADTTTWAEPGEQTREHSQGRAAALVRSASAARTAGPTG